MVILQSRKTPRISQVVTKLSNVTIKRRYVVCGSSIAISNCICSIRPCSVQEIDQDLRNRNLFCKIVARTLQHRLDYLGPPVVQTGLNAINSFL